MGVFLEMYRPGFRRPEAAVWWWSRSANYNNSNNFCNVNTDGSTNNNNASWSAGVRP